MSHWIIIENLQSICEYIFKYLNRGDILRPNSSHSSAVISATSSGVNFDNSVSIKWSFKAQFRLIVTSDTYSLWRSIKKIARLVITRQLNLIVSAAHESSITTIDMPMV